MNNAPTTMKLLLQLDEAASIPVPELLAVMKKDKRVNKIFTRKVQLDEIPDRVQFLTTLRYYLFSNPKVREWLKARGEGPNLSSYWWQRFAKTTPADIASENFNQFSLDSLADLVKTIFKDERQVAKLDISKRAVDDLLSQFDKRGGRYTSFTPNFYTVKELESLNVKPEGAVMLYRGMQFDEEDLREKSKYGGMNVANGLKFLKQIRSGSRTVDLKLETPSVWTYSKEQALLAALHGSESSWRTDTGDNKLTGYHAQLGFVISTLATPEDIIIDLAALTKQVSYFGTSHKDEVILHPGKRLARVVQKLTKQGEVDPTDVAEVDNTLDELGDSLELFGRIMKLPPEVSYRDLTYGMSSPAIRAEAGMLADDDTSAAVKKALKIWMDYYHKHLADVDVRKLVSGGRHSHVYGKLKLIDDLMDGSVSLTALKTRENRHGSTTRSKTTGADAWELSETDDAISALRAATSQTARFRDYRTGIGINNLAEISGDNRKDLHNQAKKVQDEVIKHAIINGLQLFGENAPPDQSDAIALLAKHATTAKRNAVTLNFLWNIKHALQGKQEE